MTVRVLLHDSPPKPVRRSRRYVEYFFLLIGLVALDAYIWVNVDGSYEEAFGNWSLDRQMQGERPTVADFLRNEFGLKEPPRETTAPSEHAAEPPAPPARRLATYDLIGRVEVPRLGLSAIVREGVDSSTLRTSVGHMPSTPLPGQAGNSALAAHRDTLFRKLRNIRKNDRISVETPAGTYAYVVESTKIVEPSDVEVLRAAQGDHLLTLITCYPFNYIGAAPHRFIVRARAVDVTARSQHRQIQAKS